MNKCLYFIKTFAYKITPAARNNDSCRLKCQYGFRSNKSNIGAILAFIVEYLMVLS